MSLQKLCQLKLLNYLTQCLGDEEKLIKGALVVNYSTSMLAIISFISSNNGNNS